MELTARDFKPVFGILTVLTLIAYGGSHFCPSTWQANAESVAIGLAFMLFNLLLWVINLYLALNTGTLPVVRFFGVFLILWKFALLGLALFVLFHYVRVEIIGFIAGFTAGLLATASYLAVKSMRSEG